MLPRSRILSVVLLGLGAALIAAGTLAPLLMHTDGRVPVSLEQNTLSLRDPHATLRSIAHPENGAVETPVLRQLHTTVEEPADADRAQVRVGVSVTREGVEKEDALDMSELHTAQVWSYSINRRDGQVDGDMRVSEQIASPTRTIHGEGRWLSFPPAPAEEDYAIFDDTLRGFYPARYVDKDTVEGRPVLHYRQHIEPENVAQRYPGPFTTTRLDDGSEGYLYHSARRDFWVDEETGVLLRLSEAMDEYYGRADGTRAEDVFSFAGEMSQEDVRARAEEAARLGSRSVVDIILLTCVVVGIVFCVAGAVGALWPRPHRSEEEQEVPSGSTPTP